MLSAFFVSTNTSKSRRKKDTLAKMSNHKSNNKQPNPSDLTKTCIFCGRTPLTDEEFWPKWIRKIFPSKGVNKHIGGSVYKGQLSIKKLTGHFSSKKVKFFCATCNNGWMSQIEQDVASVLTPLINNEHTCLTTADRRLIAKWAILRTIVSEYANSQDKVVSKADRQTFYRRKSAHRGWYVWIGKVSEQELEYLFRSWYGATINWKQLKTVDWNNDPPNILASLFGVKHLVIYTLYYPEAFFNYELYNGLEDKLVSIYPLPKPLVRFLKPMKISWESVPSMDQRDFKNLTENLENNFKNFGKQLNAIKERRANSS